MESTWIYSRIYPVEMWNHHDSVDFEILNGILRYNFIMNYSSPIVLQTIPTRMQTNPI